MKILLMAAMTVSLLGACTNTKLVTHQIDNVATKHAAETNISSDEAVEIARNVLVKAKTKELDYFTVLHFKSAQASYEKIKRLQEVKILEENQVKSHNLAIIAEAFKTQDLINEAFEVKNKIQQTLSASLNHKVVLDELGSAKVFPKRYSDMERDLSDLFMLIERNQMQKVQQKENNLLADMISIEVDTLVKKHVTPARVVLYKAEKIDADEYAERTYEQAELAIARAITYIQRHYREVEKIKVISNDAFIAAKKAFNTGKLSRGFVELDEERAELKALEMEALLNIIIQGFGAKDLEVLTLEEQAQELARLARKQSELKSYNIIE